MANGRSPVAASLELQSQAQQQLQQLAAQPTASEAQGQQLLGLAEGFSEQRTPFTAIAQGIARGVGTGKVRKGQEERAAKMAQLEQFVQQQEQFAQELAAEQQQKEDDKIVQQQHQAVQDATVLRSVELLGRGDQAGALQGIREFFKNNEAMKRILERDAGGPVDFSLSPDGIITVVNLSTGQPVTTFALEGQLSTQAKESLGQQRLADAQLETAESKATIAGQQAEGTFVEKTQEIPLSPTDKAVAERQQAVASTFFKQVDDAAQIARGNADINETLIGAVDASTGPIAGLNVLVNNLGKQVGIDLNLGDTDSLETIQRATQDLIKPFIELQGKGFTDVDRAAAEKAVNNIGSSTLANKKMLGLRMYSDRTALENQSLLDQQLSAGADLTTARAAVDEAKAARRGQFSKIDLIIERGHENGHSMPAIVKGLRDAGLL